MLDRIHTALRQGDFAVAQATARDLVSSEPDNAPAWNLLAIASKALGQADAAREAIERAIALDPERAAFHATRGALDLSEGKPADGLREAIALNPNELSAYVLQLHAALARGDVDEARRQLRLAQRVDSGNAIVSMAEGHVAHATGDYDLALRCYTAAATVQPNMASAQLALGLAYLQRQLWVFAEQALSNALRLDPARQRIALRGLVEAQRRQDKHAEALVTLDELVERFPAETDALGLRAELRLRLGQNAGALEDLCVVLDRAPMHLGSLRRAAVLLAAEGRGPEAVARVEAALARAPSEADLWILRLQLAGALREPPLDVLNRWLAAQPESAACLDLIADYHRSRNDLDEASSWADRALARDPTLFVSGMVKVLAEEREDLDRAIARADRMLAQTTDIEQRRMLLGWSAMALDKAGRYAEAAPRWKGLLTHLPRQGRLVPPPAVAPAEQVPEGGIAAVLAWSPVGVGAESVLLAAQEMLGPRVSLERANVMGAGDGFGLMRYPPGDARAGSAAQWTAAVTAAGMDPATVVDWLPHLDPYTLAALRGARVLALMMDPRDALLNWFVHGSLQNYLPAPNPPVAADWLARSLEALADHRDAHPDLVAIARLDGDAGEAAAIIEKALALPKPLPGVHSAAPRFAPGHWRNYREDFAEAFDRLAPVAVRLGYPAD